MTSDTGCPRRARKVRPRTRPRVRTAVCVLFLLWLHAIAGFASVRARETADGAADLVPAEFARVRSLSDITDGGCYLIGAEDAATGKLYLLSCAANGKKGTGKLIAYVHNAGAEEAFTCSTTAVLWQVQRDNATSVVTLTAPDSAKCLCRAGDALGLNLSTESSAAAQWSLTEDGDGTFALTAPGTEGGSRHLAADTSGSPAVFDHYAGSRYTYRLAFYKRRATTTGGDRTTGTPEDGARVALCDGTSVFVPGGATADATRQLLCDGTLAPAGCFPVWETKSLSDETFALKDPATGTYLAHSLTATDEPQPWRMEDGHPATAGDNPRLLCHDRTAGKWTLAAGTTLQQGTYAATLRNVCPAPTLTADSAGVVTLHGGWDCDKLTQTDFSAARCLDLTQIALPVEAGTLDGLPEGGNTPVFVDAGQEAYTPAAWPFVVLCGKDANTLRDDTQLYDRQPFHTNRPVTLSRGLLSYRREAGDGLHWQTLCLPFACSVPQGCTAVEVTPAGDGTLSATTATTLEAGKAYLIRRQSADGAAYFTFTATPQSTVPATDDTPYATDALQGTFAPLTVSRTDGDIYLLRSAQDVFAAAAAGSRLAPFRAALRPATAQKAKTLRIVRH